MKMKLNILIVDDDPVYQILIQSALEKYGHCDIAGNGREAVEAFQRALDNDKPYDLITLDIVMPSMNGREAVDAIRRIEEERGIPDKSGSVRIIITTSMDDIDNFRGAFEKGCKVVVKPFSQEELLEKVEVLCHF
jgi:two-component system chemotaxis response regulator CheY